MATSHYDQFLQEATASDPASDHGLGRACPSGLYTSWGFLSQTAPRPEDAFWAAMKEKQIHPKRNGLRMKGPAAADYILASYPGLV